MNTAREIISRTILNSKCRNLLGATKKRLISQNTEIRRYNVLALNFFFSVLCFARLIITVNTIRKNWSKVRRTYEPVINALILSLVIGMLAGAIPAYRASKLKPVDALRYE